MTAVTKRAGCTVGRVGRHNQKSSFRHLHRIGGCYEEVLNAIGTSHRADVWTSPSGLNYALSDRDVYYTGQTKPSVIPESNMPVTLDGNGDTRIEHVINHMCHNASKHKHDVFKNRKNIGKMLNRIDRIYAARIKPYEAVCFNALPKEDHYLTRVIFFIKMEYSVGSEGQTAMLFVLQYDIDNQPWVVTVYPVFEEKAPQLDHRSRHKMDVTFVL